MDWHRLKYTIGMCLRISGVKRAEYLRKHHILYHVGKNCMVMFRKIPLYPRLISIGDNVWIASQVDFIPHDVIHRMLNNYLLEEPDFQEFIGCIDIRDNVFVGSNTTILPNVTIGSNTVIAAGSVINKSIAGNGVYGGVPAKYICSLDDLIKKRRNVPRIEITRNKHRLSDETVEAVWKRFKEGEEHEQ